MIFKIYYNLTSFLDAILEAFIEFIIRWIYFLFLEMNIEIKLIFKIFQFISFRLANT